MSRYIEWVQKEWPSDTQRSFELCERCTRALKDDARYRDDPRYLKVWIAYADRVGNPGDIFRHLHKARVGRSLALFWVAWAWVAEKSGDFKFADKLYAQGVTKDAQVRVGG